MMTATARVRAFHRDAAIPARGTQAPAKARQEK